MTQLFFFLLDSLTIESVNVSDAETLALEQYCKQTNTIIWTKVGQLTSEEWMSENVTVSKPDDRGKFVCHDGNDTVHSIVYVSIKGLTMYQHSCYSKYPHSFPCTCMGGAWFRVTIIFRKSCWFQ